MKCFIYSATSAPRPLSLNPHLLRYRNNSGLGNKYIRYSRICRLKTAKEVKVDSASFNGLFQLDNIPPGRIDLFVDGRTVNPSNEVTKPQYPSLHFEAYAIKGRDNQIAHPIYLPPLSTSSESVKTVGGAEDVILTIPGLAGFQMKVKANSVTFPDGSRVGTLVVSPVTADKLPMAPPAGGAQFGVPAWTVQPAGTRFDPPIEVTLPNASSQPAGDNLPIVQWDHDLGQYVAMGRATVSEDGSVLITDSGSGLTKAGWGGLCRYDPDKCGKTAPPEVDICEELKPDADGCPVPTPIKITLFKIELPVNEPSPADGSGTYQPFYFDPRSGGSETSTIRARALVEPASLISKIEWTIEKQGTVTADAESINPADKKGLSLEFKVKGTQHPGYGSGGSRERSRPLSYKLIAKICVGKPNEKIVESIITQDQRDIIRQEYFNHAQYSSSLRIPARDDLTALVATSNFLVGANPGAYSYAWGNPLNNAQSVLNNYRTRMVTRFGGNADAYSLNLNSGWRNPERNEIVGGVINSKHQYGGAVDLTPSGLPNTITRNQAFCELLAAGQAALPYCIPERNTVQLSSCTDTTISHVHCDNRQ